MNIEKNQVAFSAAQIQAAIRKWCDIAHFDHPTAITLTMKQGIPGSDGRIRVDTTAASQTLRY